MLAGISADYYLRLERGRDRNPSVQVLEAIARVLRLDDDHVAHLLSLVSDSPRQRTRRPRREVVPPSALMLLESLVQPLRPAARHAGQGEREAHPQAPRQRLTGRPSCLGVDFSTAEVETSTRKK
ncbi:helix-turn-helix transcriptional regulator [Georgenia phoenicis]